MPPPRAVAGARPPSRDSAVPGTRLACGVTPGTRSLEPRPGGDARGGAGPPRRFCNAASAFGCPPLPERPRRRVQEAPFARSRVLGVGSRPLARATEARRAGQGHAP